MPVTIAGDNFGSSAGSVTINGMLRQCNRVEYVDNVHRSQCGEWNLSGQVTTASGTQANTIQFYGAHREADSGHFTVNNAASTNNGEYIFLPAAP